MPHATVTTDWAKPVEIASRIWWVGHVLDNDPFQSHVYLIEHGDQSVLLDPGSQLTFPHVRRKIEQVTTLENIRYVVCHHQDPDITACLPELDALITREDARLVTHWRAAMLLKHYGLRLPFWNVEEHDWSLDLGGRKLSFIFTPYAHFPGAFCTFDHQTGTLFSSDLFGALADSFELYARDESHFEAIRPFHEHYIPSRDILQFSLARLREYPLQLIAPQHGSLIPQNLIAPIMRKLETLDCGLYLLSRGQTDIQRLSALNAAIKAMVEAMVVHRDFSDIVLRLLEIAGQILPVNKVMFYAVQGSDVLLLAPESRYRGLVTEPPEAVASVLGMDRIDWTRKSPRSYRRLFLEQGPGCECGELLLMPLFAPESGRVKAVALFCLEAGGATPGDLDVMIEQMSLPLEVAVERELLYRQMDQRRQEMYELSIRDPLTGLFTRFYMQDTLQRLFALHDRQPEAALTVVMADIDHFKAVNDTYGHVQGDQVLRQVAEQLLGMVRQSDLAVRLGGEEFALVLPDSDLEHGRQCAERLRRAVSLLTFSGDMTELKVTVSLGVAQRLRQENLQDLLNRADQAMYRAKKGGRNQVALELV